MFVFHLLAGYRGSGKDSFYYYLQRNSPYNFILLKSPSYVEYNPVYIFNFLEKESKSLRIGLADEVKTLVHEDLGIKIDNLQLLDLAKNHLYFHDKITGEYVPLRNFYIKTGMAMRDIDPDFWCKKGMEHINKIFPEGLKSEEIINIFITDYRFPNEKAYFEKFGKVITYRIFSSNINGLNTLGIESEHSLDKEITDYLVLRKVEDFSDAVNIFPYFLEYKIVS
jgi:hypothetical protein